jgi:subtilisin family serine protease
MNKQKMRLLRLLIALALLVASFGAGTAAPAAGAPPLRLHRAILETLPSNRSPAINALLAGASSPYSIIQFGGPIALAERAALDATGVKRLEYIPDFAYLVRGTPQQLSRAAGVSGVVNTAAFTPADKLSPALLRMLARGASNVGQVSISGWPDDAGELARALQTLPVDTRAPLAVGALLRVANLEAVRWIEPLSRPRILNDVARSIMHVDSAWGSQSLFGAGQTVAVLDTGLDVGITPTLSPDFAGRIVATHVISAGGDIADQNGHGTHVTGSVAGAGVQSGAITTTRQYSGSFAGVAPEAGLVIQAFEADATGQTFGLGPDYYPLYNQAYADGARLHTNSWGDYTGPLTDTQTAFGGYPYGAQRTDQFVWDHPDMTIFFAAGNSGKDGTPAPPFGFCTGGDGVVDPDSLLSPGTAKNVVTVGAAESYRTTGGLSAFPWLLVDLCFGVQPIATDLVSNNPNGMAAFSSRGPTDVGRIKPDLVAPGTNIVSNQSHVPGASTLWGPYETNSNYAYSGGTSMATPLAAGAGVLARQWLGSRGLPNPSAAAVKATLLDTTADMAPGQYGTGPTQEIPLTRPNATNGWGCADLAFTSAVPPYALWVDDHTSGLATAQAVTYTHTPARSLQVMTSTQPLRVMLVWTDPPASLSASAALVNDLDLVVIGPNNTVYHGNNVLAGDRTNNVEGVIVNNPPLGAYTVRVSAFNVPIAAQPYALVVAGAIGSPPAPQRNLWLPLVIR